MLRLLIDLVTGAFAIGCLVLLSDTSGAREVTWLPEPKLKCDNEYSEDASANYADEATVCLASNEPAPSCDDVETSGVDLEEAALKETFGCEICTAPSPPAWQDECEEYAHLALASPVTLCSATQVATGLSAEECTELEYPFVDGDGNVIAPPHNRDVHCL